MTCATKDSKTAMHSLLSSGREYYRAYEILLSEHARVSRYIASDNQYNTSHAMMRRIKNGELVYTISPSCVCLIFSIELLLKALLAKDNITIIHIHKLSKLFEAVERSTKESIISEYMLSCNGSIKEQDIIDELSKMDNSFIEFRYLHDYGRASLHVEFVNNMATAILSYFKQLLAAD